jgi:M6 family metalloprotease-like protein
MCYHHNLQGFLYSLIRRAGYLDLHDRPGCKFFSFSNLMKIKAFLVIISFVLVGMLAYVPHAAATPSGKLVSFEVHDQSRTDLRFFDVKKLSGDYRLIVILVEFTDIKHEISRDAVHDMVFSRMSQYWREVSYGQFNVIGDTVGWITLYHDEAYYGKDTNPKEPGSDQRDHQLIADACKRTSGVDFSQYQDIMVVYAGHGQDSDPQDTGLLWPSAYWSGLDTECPGKKFDNGGSTSEITRAGVLDLGAFTHEFGHTIGLPDLYHKAKGSRADDFAGLWSLMASGSWGGPNNDGSTPTGLESWSRTKLGWVSSTSVRLTPDPFVQALNQLGDTTDPRVLKVATKGSRYYLVEIREKIGADEYLPDSGVLITRIDEARQSGQGIVRVMDCHAETETIDDATCKVNETWEDKTDDIYVKVIGKQGANYVIAIASRPVSIVQVTLSVEPSISGVIVKLDGLSYDFQQLPAIFIWAVGSEHVLEVQTMIEDGSGIRYVFAGWNDGERMTTRTVTASSSVTFTANFKTQYLLTVKSAIGAPQGSGWYDAGSTAVLSVSSPLPTEGFMGILGGKYVFDHWTGDLTSTNSTASFAMNGPTVVTAEWRVDNTLPHMVISGIVAVSVVIIALLLMKLRKAQSRLAGEKQPFAEAAGQQLRRPPRWCVSCGKEVMQESVFCEHCGARQPESQQ